MSSRLIEGTSADVERNGRSCGRSLSRSGIPAIVFLFGTLGVLAMLVSMTACTIDVAASGDDLDEYRRGKGNSCGNGKCSSKEDCETCPTDCGLCPAEPFCGDDTCDVGEGCETCEADCGLCPVEPFCGDDTCDVVEDCETCEMDCGLCPAEPFCGDNTCDAGEDCASCETDCGDCSGAPLRAFADDSYWNTPMPTDAPIDPNSDLYLAYASDPSVSMPYIRISGAPDHSGGQAWAYPIYWSTSSDPMYTISPSRYGPDISVRIPAGASPNSGSDAAIIIFDLDAFQVFGMWKASYDSSTDTWSASSTKRYALDSNGLSKRVEGHDNSLNDGHRGIPSAIRAVRIDEAAHGVIARRLECFWHATGRPNDATPWYYWPMDGYESGKGGITPEGLVLRIKPSVDLEARGFTGAGLVIARAMQNYGCMIGDNDGGIRNSIKLEREPLGGEWAEIDAELSVDTLSVLSWSDYEFIEGGYDPR